jgi:hypothetical protein
MVGTVARLCYFKCMAEFSTTLLRRRILSECSGECGDLGTFIPHAIGAITVAGLAPAGVLLGFAVLFYRHGTVLRPATAGAANEGVIHASARNLVDSLGLIGRLVEIDRR